MLALTHVSGFIRKECNGSLKITPRPECLFSIEERVFIIKKFTELKSTTDVRQTFRQISIPMDENYFVLKHRPNKNIHRFWAPKNPNIIIECKSQSQQKEMCWTGLSDGKVLVPFWIEETINQYVYNELSKDKVWPLLQHQVYRKKLYFICSRPLVTQPKKIPY